MKPAVKAVSAEAVAEGLEDPPELPTSSRMVPTRGPVATIRTIASVGAATPETLGEAAFDLKKGTRTHLASVRSALKAWHLFAVLILTYAATATFPPRKGSDVEAFVSCFKSGDTAGNYVGALRWTAQLTGASLLWDTPGVQMAIKGARKRTSQMAHVALGNRSLLTTRLVWAVVSFLDATQSEHWLSPLLLLAWAILGRVQSEILPLLRGQEANAIGLPENAHSAVWQDAQKTLWVRLRRRKHRPAGSLLSTPCECPRSPAHCAACRVARYIEQQRIRVGAPLWPGATPAISLAALQRVLTLLGVAAPTSYTWKAVRAGHATELALTPGVSLADIMKRGEWRSGSVLAYVRPDDVHVPTFVAQTLEMSDAEADE